MFCGQACSWSSLLLLESLFFVFAHIGLNKLHIGPTIGSPLWSLRHFISSLPVIEMRVLADVPGILSAGKEVCVTSSCSPPASNGMKKVEG